MAWNIEIGPLLNHKPPVLVASVVSCQILERLRFELLGRAFLGTVPG